MLNTGVGDEITVETILNLLNAVNRSEEVRQTMKPTMVTAATFLALLAGCAVGTKLSPAQSGCQRRNGLRLLPVVKPTAPPTLAAWWKKFGDTNLDSLMVTAVESNLTLRIAEAHVREARAERGVVAGGLWPSVGIQASYLPESLGKKQLSAAATEAPAGLQSLQSRI